MYYFKSKLERETPETCKNLTSISPEAFHRAQGKPTFTFAFLNDTPQIAPTSSMVLTSDIPLLEH